MSAESLPSAVVSTRTQQDREKRAQRIAIGIWVTLAVVVSGVILAGNKRTVSTVYVGGAERWIAGEDLYDESGAGFIYMPQSAILFTGLVPLPHEAREILWRLIAISVFASGIYYLCQLFREGDDGHGTHSTFLLITVLTVPLAWSATRNGQATLPMAGLMMHASWMLRRNRHVLSSVLLVVAVMLKPLAIVMAMLVFALHPKTRVPMLLAGLAGAVLPFCCQEWNYALSQYAGSQRMLKSAHDLGATLHWAQFFGMLKAFGISVIDPVQLATRLITAVATLALCWHVHRTMSANRSLFLLYAFATCYLMLMNPRTENNTYAMLAPVIACYVVAGVRQKQFASAGYSWVCGVAILCSYEVGKHFVDDPLKAVWMAPLAATFFTVYLTVHTLIDSKRGDQISADQSEEQSVPPVLAA